MNRPFGAVDVAANLKGAVPKTATQKILVTLAEKGELVQKTYGARHHHLSHASIVSCGTIGKTTFFVANQANLEDMPADKLASLESEYNAIQEDNKTLMGEVRSATAGTNHPHIFTVPSLPSSK